MDTTERMMIVGLCLQGLLANPNWTNKTTGENIEEPHPYKDGATRTKRVRRLMTPEELETQRVRVYKEALLMADLLDPRPKAVAAERISRLTKVAAAALDALDFASDTDMVFDCVVKVFADPSRLFETTEERLIKAIVLASAEEAE